MQAQGSSSIVGLRGNYRAVPDATAKPTPQQRAAARNELDRYPQMNWDDNLDSHAELQDPALWISDTNNPTLLQEDIEMLKATMQTVASSSSAAIQV